MAGIDGITAEILAGAQAEVDKILAEARANAAHLTDAAKKESETTLAKESAAAKEKAAAQKERAISQAEMETRQTLLSEKQKIISRIIDAARDRLHAQESGDYFGMLEKVLAQTVRKGDGEICLSKEDLARVPADFLEKASKAAEAAGGTVKISEQPADIADGFILRYGGIEENCSLAALFSEKKEVLHDLVSGLLF